ncbi:MAG: acyl-CoA dehydrogenase domain protein [Rhodospirillales bacterium]|nr:acyl-CoA dehydrogenase domain protein [Rhodospirillales bacterium]
MKLGFTAAEEAFRGEIAGWFERALTGDFARLRGPTFGRDDIALMKSWERHLGDCGLGTIAWPRAYGGRAATLIERVIFAEEEARAGLGPRPNHIAVELVGPTIFAFGRDDQKSRFLPPIAAGREFWAQCFSEPGAGSDLANLRTKAQREGGKWVIEGQKIWSSLAHIADWGLVLCRTEAGSVGSRGLSLLLVPMAQPHVTIRPIRQMTGESEFNEIFFDGARTAAHNIIGEPGDGWKAAMATLGFERGVSTLGTQARYRRELELVLTAARDNGKAADPAIRQRLARAEIGLRVMRANSLRMLANMECQREGREAVINKLYYATWHQELGELAMDVLGRMAELAEGMDYAFPPLTRMFLFSRADTIYAGTHQIQRNIIAERVLGLPRDPR